VRQIADRIAADILAGGSGQARADPVPSLPSAPMAQLPLKVLTIQLHPAELGAVTVRIALKNDVLELQIEAGRRDTARLVDADRETLSSLLRSAGYSVETMTVRAVDPSSAPASVGSSHGSPDGAPQSQAGGSQPDARPSGGRPHAEQDGNLRGTRRDGTDEQDGARHRAGDGLYV
jgi:chemotaxis protein MotD